MMIDNGGVTSVMMVDCVVMADKHTIKRDTDDVTSQ